MTALLIILAVLAALFFLVTFLLFFITFYAWKDPRKPVDPEFDLAPGKIYEPFYPVMREWARASRALPKEDMWITSHDGLKLHGTYYEYAPGAPIELMFHGYRGTAERDLCGGVQRCFSLGRSALIVDQRTSGQSEGKVITFGIHESRDLHAWVEFMVKHFGPEVRIILTGISMGAATVMIAAGQELPSQVVGVLADCGFTSAEDIIRSVIRQMGLPDKIAYPFVRLGARLFGHFDLEATSPIEAVKNCRLPVIFFHGEDDDYVPCRMSRETCEACGSTKTLCTVPGAGHGLSYLVDPEKYLDALRKFAVHWGL